MGARCGKNLIILSISMAHFSGKNILGKLQKVAWCSHTTGLKEGTLRLLLKILRLNMDYHDKYDKQQKDWRLLTEDGFASKRQLYTNGHKLRTQFNDPFWDADKLIFSATEADECEKMKLRLPGNQFRYGYNTV